MVSVYEGGFSMKKFLENYKHGLWALYAPVYLMLFNYIEKNRFGTLHILNTAIDDKIPFLEIFIVPYILWFGYMFVGTSYFFIVRKERENFHRLALTLCTGMSLFILVSLLYPNGLTLRPTTFTRDNVFIDLVKFIYRHDTATNVLPSIHVYNSICINGAVLASTTLKNRPKIRLMSTVMCFLIVASTVFVKQHSLIDVAFGILMYFVVDAFAGVVMNVWRKNNALKPVKVRA